MNSTHGSHQPVSNKHQDSRVVGGIMSNINSQAMLSSGGTGHPASMKVTST